MSIETMKQAFETLKRIDDAMPFPVAKLTMQQLRQAIEQDKHCKHCTDGCLACDARKLPEQTQKQEPVAWYYAGSYDEWPSVALNADLDEAQKANCTPLYTSPPQRQPLTENEIKHLWYEACQTNLELTSQLIVHLARNIEAAHGIKGEA